MGADHSGRAMRAGAGALALVAGVLVAAALLVAGVLFDGLGLFGGSGSHTARAQSPAVPVTKAPSPPIVISRPAATIAQPLPTPEPAPADPYEKVPVVAVGEIEIPKIGLVHTIYEGVSLTVVDHGPGHWPGTPMPGGWGNSVFAGHRTTNSRPFRNVDDLVEGDAIVFRTDQGTFTYRVTKTEVVHWDDVWIVDQHPGRTLTLFACHPPGSAEFRYVVFGELDSA